VRSPVSAALVTHLGPYETLVLLAAGPSSTDVAFV